MSPEPVVDWALYERARASEKVRTATSQEVVEALAAVVADTIVTYLDVPFDSVPELSGSVQRILGPIADYPHAKLSIKVQRELTENLYSHRLRTPSPARPDGYRRPQPRHANTVEAWATRILSDIGECYELPDPIKMHVRRELATLFADLGVAQHD